MSIAVIAYLFVFIFSLQKTSAIIHIGQHGCSQYEGKHLVMILEGYLTIDLMFYWRA